MNYEMLPTKQEIEDLYNSYFIEPIENSIIDPRITENGISKLNAKYDYQILKKIFDPYPNNSDYEQTLLKVYILNKLYNTQLEKRHNIGLFIKSINKNSEKIDQYLKEGNPDVVELIRWINNSDKIGQGEYSFATKFCYFHNPDKYVIYDSNVDIALWLYKDHIGLESRKELKNYPYYKCIIELFAKQVNATDLPKRQIEFFLYKKGQQILYKK